jgi:hypothetical protein
MPAGTKFESSLSLLCWLSHVCVLVHHHHLHECFKSSFLPVGRRFESSLSLLCYLLHVCCVSSSLPSCTSVSNLLSSLDVCGCVVQVLSHSSLFAIARVCDGSSPSYAQVFQIFFPCRVQSVRGSSPLSHFSVCYFTCVCWFTITNCTSVSNLLFSLDADEYEVRVLSLTSLLAIARVYGGSLPPFAQVSNLLFSLDSGGYEVRVLSLISLMAIACVCDGSLPPFVFQIFILCWMLVGTRYKSLSHFFVSYHTCVVVHHYHLHECFKSFFLV